jgi:trehalose synthase-fused probable maltokinase
VHTAEALREARWFGGKSRPISGTRVIDRVRWAGDAAVSLVEVQYADTASEIYVLADRFEEPAAARALLQHFRADGNTLATERGGALIFRPTHVFRTIPPERLEPVVLLRGEQSNTSLRFGDALIMKLFRRLQFGPNPDVEIGLFLTERTGFTGTPPVAGSATYVSPGGQEAALVLLEQFEPNRGDAWTTTLERVAFVLDGAAIETTLPSIQRLGATTAELHVALASGTDAFGAETIGRPQVNAWLASLVDEVHLVARALSTRNVDVDESALVDRAAGLAGLEGSLETRHHGDYHLGQVLEREDGAYRIIDFEGEPSRPMDQRREKRSPLRDVAGMLRSFDYARHAALRARGAAHEGAEGRAAADWYDAARRTFLDAYLTVAHTRPRLVPDDISAPLAALELEKAAYEVLYELNNRPEWLHIPLASFTCP